MMQVCTSTGGSRENTTTCMFRAASSHACCKAYLRVVWCDVCVSTGFSYAAAVAAAADRSSSHTENGEVRSLLDIDPFDVPGK